MNPTEQSGRALAARIKELCDRKIRKAAEHGDFQCFVRRDEMIDSDSTMEPILMAIVSAYARDQPNLKTAWSNRLKDGEQHMCLKFSWMPPQDQAVALATQWLADATPPALTKTATNAIRQAGLEQADRMAKGLVHTEELARMEMAHMRAEEEHRRAADHAELVRRSQRDFKDAHAQQSSRDPYLFIDDYDEPLRSQMLRAQAADAKRSTEPFHHTSENDL